ncbi:MAG: DUF2752 domain-containing protein [Lentisphaeria bacterium]|nr:DUF2752 domain-containing protein [Lentisphaeria bacterium]NQZ66911.1 DUF2752 domain-containing protein [Lentisphaeria bacterium]
MPHSLHVLKRRWPYYVLIGLSFSVVLFFFSIFIVSTVVSPSQLETKEIVLSPACENPAQCISCGMTRGFCSVSRLQIDQAMSYNKLTVPVYIFFMSINLFFIFLIYYLRKNKRSYQL